MSSFCRRCFCEKKKKKKTENLLVRSAFSFQLWSVSFDPSRGRGLLVASEHANFCMLTRCTFKVTWRIIITVIFLVGMKEDVLVGRSLCSCTHGRHAAPSHSSGAKAAGNPRTKPSSRHLSACACDCRAAPPPGNLGNASHTHTHTQMSFHGMMNVPESGNDRFKKDPP